jgi:hypothetical protein
MRLQQGFATGGMGFGGQFARQQSWVAHVRFGSEADIRSKKRDVRFTPKSGHCRSRRIDPLDVRKAVPCGRAKADPSWNAKRGR